MKFSRPIDAVIARPGNPQEAAFAAGYKGLPSAYKKSQPSFYQAGAKLAQTVRKPPAKRASYRGGIEWIAQNDETSESDPETMSTMISVLLLADLFGKEPVKVARDVIRYRTEEGLI